MKRENILKQIKIIVEDVVGHDTFILTEKTQANEIKGWDSLNHIHIILQVENKYGFRMKATEVAQLKNLGSLIDIVIANNKSQY